jgi:gamma-polyglutamate biosynthesis protein CapC
MLELSMALSIFGGWLSYEFLGFSPGGIVTPGYLALFIDQPLRLIGTLVVSGITYALVKLFSCWMVLYGRRRFAFTMLLSFMLGWLWDIFAGGVFFYGQEMRVIGFIVPGLIANDLEKQGLGGTLSALVVVLAFVRLGILTAGFFWGSV